MASTRKTKTAPAQPGDVVTLESSQDALVLMDDIGTKPGNQKIPVDSVATVLETRTYARVIVGTTVGWVDLALIKST